jgi:hypothetical protein
MAERYTILEEIAVHFKEGHGHHHIFIKIADRAREALK